MSVSGCNCSELPFHKRMDSRDYITMAWVGAFGSNPMCKVIHLHNKEVY